VIVAGVLILTPTAALKVRTARMNPISGRLDDAVKRGAYKTGLVLIRGSLHPPVFGDKRNKRRCPRSAFVRWKARQAVSAIDQLFNFELHPPILNVNERFRRNSPFLLPRDRLIRLWTHPRTQRYRDQPSPYFCSTSVKRCTSMKCAPFSALGAWEKA